MAVGFLPRYSSWGEEAPAVAQQSEGTGSSLKASCHPGSWPINQSISR